MKRRALALAMIALLCISALLSGTLLILHSDHACDQLVCPVCMMLANRLRSILSAFALLASAGIICAISPHFRPCPAEDRVVPVWTLVHRKVKLLD